MPPSPTRKEPTLRTGHFPARLRVEHSRGCRHRLQRPESSCRLGRRRGCTRRSRTPQGSGPCRPGRSMHPSAFRRWRMPTQRPTILVMLRRLEAARKRHARNLPRRCRPGALWPCRYCVCGSSGFERGKGLAGRWSTRPWKNAPKALGSSPDLEQRGLERHASVGKTDVRRCRDASSVTASLLLRGHGELVGPVIASLVRSAGLGVSLDLPPPHFLVALRGLQEPLP